MKNILILSASTGGGHNQVANALNEELTQRDYHVIKVEPLKEASKVLDTIISDGYKVLATKMPMMYGGIYKLSNKKTINKPIAKVSIRALKKCISKSIEEHSPSLIISTHPLIVNVVAALKASGRIDIPFISVITDFAPHQSYINYHVDAYIVGSFFTKKGLIKCGIPENKIYTYGIPIRSEFKVKYSTGIRDDRFTILLMGGSMGVSYIKKALKKLLNNELNKKVIVVCGNNDKLREAITEKYKNYIQSDDLTVYGFTNKIPLLMEISDVIITKPGGLTTSEAIAKNIPMIIPFFIPGQEEENAEFLHNEGAAIVVKEFKELSKSITELIENPEKLVDMKNKMSKLSEGQSLENVVQLINELIDEANMEWDLIKEG